MPSGGFQSWKLKMIATAEQIGHDHLDVFLGQAAIRAELQFQHQFRGTEMTLQRFRKVRKTFRIAQIQI